MTGFILSDRSPLNDGWLVFGQLLSECVSPARTDTPAAPYERARVSLTVRLLNILRDWWQRPRSEAANTPAIDAATRLEVLVRGRFSQ